jgi:molybdopterin converting factor small subunit
MNPNLELTNLAAEPCDEWQRMLRFVDLDKNDRAAMVRTVETLLERSKELVVNSYDYLLSVPETASILGWEQGADEEHLEERRRFFTIWLTRTLGLDTSDEFAEYLFRAGQIHAGHGPRHIHTPSAYVTTSVALVQASFSRYLGEAQFPGDIIAQAMSGWAKYLSVQLNQMLLGYQIAQEFEDGEYEIQFKTFGLLRPLVGKNEFIVHAGEGARSGDLLRKFFNYYPQARSEALVRKWDSDDREDSLWVEINPVYIPRQGWRFLLNGRDLDYVGGFATTVEDKDQISIFPIGR